MANLVHKWLVEALGEDEAAGSDGWLSSNAWAAALERVRARRFPELDAAEGARRIGVELGERFLAGEVGGLVRETMPLISLDRVMELLVPQLSTRLRRPFEVSWERDLTGGRLRISGPIAARPETTLGFFQAVLSLVSERPQVTLESSTAGEIVLRVTK
ncbi:MAG: DUF2378 family protein [Myxococcota bacterium]